METSWFGSSLSTAFNNNEQILDFCVVSDYDQMLVARNCQIAQLVRHINMPFLLQAGQQMLPSTSLDLHQLLSLESCRGIVLPTSILTSCIACQISPQGCLQHSDLGYAPYLARNWTAVVGNY